MRKYLMLESSKDKMAEGNSFGGFYIFAPENAEPINLINDFEPMTFERAALFGSSINDSLYIQDGVAHQAPIPGFEGLRTPITPTWFEPNKMRFDEAHFFKL